jgi:hypothetical protein
VTIPHWCRVSEEMIAREAIRIRLNTDRDGQNKLNVYVQDVQVMHSEKRKIRRHTAMAAQ